MTNGPTCVYIYIYIAGLSKVPKKLSGWNCEGPGIYIYVLVGGAITILKNMSSSMGRMTSQI